MIILIKTESLTFSLDVQPTDSVDVLFNKVSERCEKKSFQFNLIYAGEALTKGTVQSFGIKKECTIHMVLVKELKFDISYEGKLYPISIPNNDGLKISHLIRKIQDDIGCELIEMKTSKIVLSKHGSNLIESNSLQEKLGNNDVVDMKLTPITSTSASSSTQAEEEDNSNDQDLLKSFVDSAISSDVEIVFCFDTTGSMSSIIEQVKTKVRETVTRLMTTIPNIKIGIMGLGDYCDKENVLKTLDLTDQVDTITTFIKNIPHTGGGDFPEAYEYALYRAKELSWSKHTSKAFVLIGDANPHEPSHTDLHINWFEECDKLFDIGIKIYGVKALGNSVFYEEIAERTGGLCINFRKFNLITEMFLAICYREASKDKFDKYQNELKEKGEVNNDLSEILNDLNKENYNVKSDQVDENNEKVNQVLKNNNNNNDDSSSSSTTTTSTSTSKQVIKQRGKPISMKSNECWFNHLNDTTILPTFTYNSKSGYFKAYYLNPVTVVSSTIESSKRTSKCNIIKGEVNNDLSEIFNDLNKENYKTIDEENEEIDQVLNNNNNHSSTTTTTTTTTTDTATTTSTTPTEKYQKIRGQQRDAKKCYENWYNFSLDKTEKSKMF